MYALNNSEIFSVTGGATTVTAPQNVTLNPSQLEYLTVLLTQSVITIAAGTPAGTAAKVGLLGLNLLGTASAQLFSNYMFPKA